MTRTKKLYRGKKHSRKDHGPARHTHSVAAGLEDALAVVLDVLFEMESSLLFSSSRLRRLMTILKTLRSGPYAYNQEDEAGPRIKRRLKIG